MRRASLVFMYVAGSNPLSSPAMRTGNRPASKRVIHPMPDSPRLTASQVVATSFPNGVKHPIPVTTTRLSIPLLLPNTQTPPRGGGAGGTAASIVPYRSTVKQTGATRNHRHDVRPIEHILL